MVDDRTSYRPSRDLSRFAILDGAGQAARRVIDDTGREIEVAAGAQLIHQGHRSDGMYFVLEGRLGVYVDRIEGEPLAFILAGETVGEMGVLNGMRASAHVVALEPTRLLYIDEDAFWELINGSHAFAVNLLVLVSERLRRNMRTVSADREQRLVFERVAMFDGLTGIHNRRWLDQTLGRMISRSTRGPKRASCAAMVDVDHFKQFNDDHGHDAGDHVLIAVARALVDNVRPTDLVARYGGEEFVIIFPDTRCEHAVVAAERVRLAVARMMPQVIDGKELPPTTISVGVAELYAGQSAADLLKAADGALYQAKELGRNRVCAAAPAPAGGGSSEADR